MVHLVNCVGTVLRAVQLLGSWLMVVGYVAVICATWATNELAGQESPAEVAEFAAKCEQVEPGGTVRGYLELIEYRAGDMPLILAAPHGGRKGPSEFPARTEGTLVSDANTDRLARAVADAAGELTGSRPHLIVCELQRKYMDANRPLDAACSPDSGAVRSWHEYQLALIAAKRRVTKAAGRGLFIELHGHGHPKQRLELGYLLRERDFDLPLAEFEGLKGKTSLREIAERGQLTLDELIRGGSSLSGLLEKEGLATVPGPTDRSPGKDLYFNGGWNTMTHGSRDAGTISSIQIECHRQDFRDSEESLKRSSRQLASAIVQFLELHYAVRPLEAK